jgi:hypothetical protein
MRKRKKKYKLKRHELYSILGMLVLIAVMLFAIFLEPIAKKFFLDTFIRFEPSTSRSGETQISEQLEADRRGYPRESASTEEASRESASIPLQGSFTELFSGVGWKNPVNSNIHQDFRTLTVSFPPAYEISPVSSISPVSPVVSGDTVTIGSRTFTVKVEKVGEQYEGYLYEIVDGQLVELRSETAPNDTPNGAKLFTSQYAGEIIFGSDGLSKLFLLYSAYQGEAFEFRVDPLLKDSVPRISASMHFNARVMEEGAIEPRIFYKSGAWWIFSVNNRPKLLRIRSGMASDLTDTVISQTALNGTLNGANFFAAPAPEANTIYIILSDKTYRLRDLGFSAVSRDGSRRFASWESLRLNAWEGEIVRGRFIRIVDSQTALNGTLNGAKIKYFLSNDGGRNWAEAELNKFVNFETTGGDFRWRAELFSSGSQYKSPWIKQIGVEYYIIRE